MSQPQRRSSRQPSRLDGEEELEERKSDGTVSDGESSTEEEESAASSSRPRTSAAGGAEAAHNIQVLCRFRPESAREVAERAAAQMAAAANGEPPPRESFVDYTPDGRACSVTLEGKTSATYTFDRVFGPDATQNDVFEAVGRHAVEGVLDGFNSAVLSFGQTSSGKTFTMVGPGFDGRDLGTSSAAASGVGGADLGLPAAGPYVEQDPGLIPRIMQSLFSRIAVLESDDVEYAVRCSYIEIYLENVRDLLNPLPERNQPNGGVPRAPSLTIRQDAQRGMLLPDATEVPLLSLADLFAVLRLGARHRKVASTKANDVSSRSHAILLVSVLRRAPPSQGGSRTSQLYLADLAGSEKVEKTEVAGLNLTEANRINQGLLSLGQVIQALVKQGQHPNRTVHIPYRNSRLTRLLSNSIGGNSRTFMLLACSPSPVNLRETLSTLRFGDALKQIKNRSVRNAELSAAELKALLLATQTENEQLKQRIKALEKELRRGTTATAAGATTARDELSMTPRPAPSSTSSSPSPNPKPSPSEELARQERLMQQQEQKLQARHDAEEDKELQRWQEDQLQMQQARQAWTVEEPSSASVSSASSSASSSLLEASPRLSPSPISSASCASSALSLSLSPCPPSPSPLGGHPLDFTEAEVFVPPSLLIRPSRARNTAGDVRQLLLSFICPLSKKVMADPVVALDGLTYERSAIAAYFAAPAAQPLQAIAMMTAAGGKAPAPQQLPLCSPITGQLLASKQLVPNVLLARLIRQFYPELAARRGYSFNPATGISPPMGMGVGAAGALLDPPYLSILPQAVLSYLAEWLDARSLVRLGQTSRELLQGVASEQRVWKLLVFRMRWPFDADAVAKLGGSAKAYYRQQALQRCIANGGLAKYGRESNAPSLWKTQLGKGGLYLAAPPTAALAANSARQS